MNDLKFAFRQLLKNPGSTALAVLILALGIGGNTAVFSVVDKAIMNPIPGEGADRLILIEEVRLPGRTMTMGVSPPLFAELAAHTNVFESLAAVAQYGTELTLDQGDGELRFTGLITTPTYFDVVGARPLLGRTFLPDEGPPGNDQVLVASYGFWQRQFGGDPNLVGRSVPFKERSYTVVGIMPASFQFPPDAEGSKFWVPHQFTAAELEPGSYDLRQWGVVARLQEGVSQGQGNALLEILAQRRQQEQPEGSEKWTIEAKPARTLFVTPTLERTLWTLQAAILMLLLISCANVGILLASRVAARTGEFNIRLAMGAGSLRLICQLITESLLLAAIAGALGVFFAWGGIRALDHLYLENVSRLRSIAMDGPVLALTVFVSTLTGLFFGVAPAWVVSRLRLAGSLKAGTQQQSGGPAQRQFQDVLVALQVGLAVVLLMGGGLMIRSTVNVLRVNPGLEAKGLYRVFFAPPVTTVRIDYGEAESRGLSGPEAYSEAFRREVQLNLLWHEIIVERLQAVPGVEAAAISESGYGGFNEYRVEGHHNPVRLHSSYIGVRSGDYFHTVQARLVAGRLFTEEDCVPGQQNVVINREMARRCWPGEDPLSKRFAFYGEHRGLLEGVVVGVIEDILAFGKEAPPMPVCYVPRERLTGLAGGGDFMIRTGLEAGSLYPLLEELAHDLGTTLVDLRSIEANLRISTAPRRLYMWLLTAMGALGLLLSALGLHAVLAFSVIRRTKEVGVRMALGASQSNIARLVAGHGARLVLNGMALGGVAAFTLSHYLESFLYEVTSADPWTLAGVLLVLSTVAGIACYLPARRAARVEPMEALRHE